MDLYEISALLITLAALFNYINYRTLKLPATIGMMAFGLAISLLIVLLGRLFPQILETATGTLSSIDFNKAFMNGMLGLLLFAGALHVNMGELTAQKGTVALLATVGVLLSTALVGGAMWLILPLLGFELQLTHCLLFGALIAPTDPIAVLSVLKKLAVPRSLEVKIAGESLFNDGVGVVVFIALLGVAGLGSTHHEVTAGWVALIFVQEVGGGLLFGAALGGLAYLLLRSVDDYQVEILISLAVVMGGYSLAHALHVSGPLAMVVAGLLIGNHVRGAAMSPMSRERLDMFWELVDEFLNAVLFMLIGLELLTLTLSGPSLAAGLIAIPVALLARFLAVGLPMSLLSFRRSFAPHAVKILTWGGLRGGISVALALWLGDQLAEEHHQERDLILTMAYSVVVFSILVQGLTIERLISKLGLKPNA